MAKVLNKEVLNQVAQQEERPLCGIKGLCLSVKNKTVGAVLGGKCKKKEKDVEHRILWVY